MSKLIDSFFQGPMLKSHMDKRGNLAVLNFRDIPFEPKRLFWISNVPCGTSRGHHGHHKGKQFLVCQEGQTQIKVWPPRAEKATEISLVAGDNFFLPAEHWIEMKFMTEGTVLLVIADREYDPRDLFTEPIK